MAAWTARQAHAKASAIKLFCSEAGFRVVDKAVQIFGGRGTMCENPVERLTRDVRLERIWEGTSEIQKMVIGGQVRKARPRHVHRLGLNPSQFPLPRWLRTAPTM